MESNQVQMYHISKSEQPNDKENVILRALVADPNRHKPLEQHPPPTTIASQEATPSSMYTLETRYRPIPSKVLPKRTETKVYYIGSSKAEQTPAPSSPIMREEPDTSLPAEQEIPIQMEEAPEPSPIVFLEPKIISQPILYSIVAAKTFPVQHGQPIPTNKETPSPILYAITGQPRPPTTDVSANTLNVAPPVIEKLPILYTLVGSPRRQVRIQEPVKEVSQIPQQTSSNLNSVVGNSHPQPQMQKPAKQVSKIPIQPSPILYSIVGNPTLTPHITQTNILDPPPSTQSVKVSSVQPQPILYTIVSEIQVPNNIPKKTVPPLASIKRHANDAIMHTVVGETQVPNNIPKETVPSIVPIKRKANDAVMHTVVGDPSIPQSMTIPRKIQPSEPQKQQQQQQAQLPTLYPLVGNPNPIPEENTRVPLKPLVRSQTPPRAIVPTRRISRSLERQSAPKSETEPVTSMPQIKNKRLPKLKEPSIPKSETTFLPLPDKERVSRPKQRRISPEQPDRRSFHIRRYDSLRLPDYISPYAYHPSRPYREQTVHPTSLPIIPNNRSERQPRLAFYEPRNRVGRTHTYDPWIPHSLERYSVRLNRHPRLWDYEYEAQTDVDDDDDDINGLSSNRKKQSYRRIRQRAPWVPVW